MRCGIHSTCQLQGTGNYITVAVDVRSGGVVEEAVCCIRNGGILAYPTETVYGIGCDPFKQAAVERVTVLKGRPKDRGLVLLVAGPDSLESLVKDVTEQGRLLIDRLWPGPLTLVFEAACDVPSWIVGHRGTVAVRMSSDPVAAELVAKLGGPLVSTSANQTGHPPALSIQDLDSTISEGVDLVVDGGPRTGGVPSTIIDVSSGRPRTLREGPLGRGEIEQALAAGKGGRYDVA